MTIKKSHAPGATGPPGANQPDAVTERGEEHRALPEQCEFVTDWQVPQPVVEDAPLLLVIGHGHLVQTALGPVLQELPPDTADCLFRDERQSSSS
jgi:hypothetical protein